MTICAYAPRYAASLARLISVTLVGVLLSLCFLQTSEAKGDLLWLVKKKGRMQGYLFAAPPVEHASLRRVADRVSVRGQGTYKVCFAIEPNPRIYQQLKKNLKPRNGPKLDKTIRSLVFKDIKEHLMKQGETPLGVKKLSPWGAYYSIPGPWVGERVTDSRVYTDSKRVRRSFCSLLTLKTLPGGFNDLSNDSKSALLKTALEFAKLPEEAHHPLFKAYLKQDLKSVIKYAIDYPDLDKHNLKKLYKVLIQHHNAHMLKGILKQFESSSKGVTFVLNALHFGGKDGLLEGLKRSGYQLAPVEL